MRIKEITVGASRTINMGNYESIRVEGSCTIELDDDDSVIGPAREAAIAECKLQMNEAYKAIKPAK